MEPIFSKVLIELGIVCMIAIVTIAHWRSKPTLPLPPGPPGEFLLGHTRVIPKNNTAGTYARWSREYNSDIIYVKSLGRSIVVLNSAEAARDVLERKGANFCDRPKFTVLEVMGWGKTLTFLPFGERWQMHRRLLQTSFSNTNVRRWHKLQMAEARRTVRNILHRPDGWETSLRRLAVAIVLQVSYGTEVPNDDDPYIQIANDAMYATGNGGAPANSIIDLVPPARHLPDWLIRDWSLRFARQWRWAIQKLHDVPFDVAWKEHDNLDDNTSLAHQLLSVYKSNEALGNKQEWSLDDIKGAAGAVFIAGADTTWATCVIFILNMVLHPEIQEKARNQLDSVIGTDRLPAFSDRGSLPYIEHIVQEVYRWSPLAPLGIPHKSLRDDVYQGMFIPKGTVVYANAHAMAHDERIYQAPHDFNPDRYEPLAEGGPGEPFPVGNFGFGRRVCVGRFLADNSVWIMVATMLATLEFRKKRDGAGNIIEPQVSFTNGGTCHPQHFECSIKPRSPEALVLVGAN
ncbi:cytochrome P450 [Ilyonectria destructans]|nr:cytochrome P450 [Ilyonectria destructans]